MWDTKLAREKCSFGLVTAPRVAELHSSSTAFSLGLPYVIDAWDLNQWLMSEKRGYVHLSAFITNFNSLKMAINKLIENVVIMANGCSHHLRQQHSVHENSGNREQLQSINNIPAECLRNVNSL